MSDASKRRRIDPAAWAAANEPRVQFERATTSFFGAPRHVTRQTLYGNAPEDDVNAAVALARQQRASAGDDGDDDAYAETGHVTMIEDGDAMRQLREDIRPDGVLARTVASAYRLTASNRDAEYRAAAAAARATALDTERRARSEIVRAIRAARAQHNTQSDVYTRYVPAAHVAAFLRTAEVRGALCVLLPLLMRARARCPARTRIECVSRALYAAAGVETVAVERPADTTAVLLNYAFPPPTSAETVRYKIVVVCVDDGGEYVRVRTFYFARCTEKSTPS